MAEQRSRLTQLVLETIVHTVVCPGFVIVVLPYLLLSSGHELYAFDGRSRVVFHLFVTLYEEPTLRRSFGVGYEEYCARVPRWIPRQV